MAHTVMYAIHMNHWIYFTNPDTEAVHLARFDDVARHNTEARTLCERSTALLTEGDESLSGVSATCGTCEGRR